MQISETATHHEVVLEDMKPVHPSQVVDMEQGRYSKSEFKWAQSFKLQDALLVW